MSTNQSIYKGDDTGSFGNTFITIDINNPLGYPISKAIFVCGCIEKSFENPIFPLTVNFTSEETRKLGAINTGYLVVYDSQGRQRTCNGSITFNATKGVIHNVQCF